MDDEDEDEVDTEDCEDEATDEHWDYVRPDYELNDQEMYRYQEGMTWL